MFFSCYNLFLIGTQEGFAVLMVMVCQGPSCFVVHDYCFVSMFYIGIE